MRSNSGKRRRRLNDPKGANVDVPQQHDGFKLRKHENGYGFVEGVRPMETIFSAGDLRKIDECCKRRGIKTVSFKTIGSNKLGSSNPVWEQAIESRRSKSRPLTD